MNKAISIAAVSKEGVMGRKGALPWHVPEDLKFFKDSTRGKTVLMGRKTFESLKKPLPHRRNVVVTRDPEFKKEIAASFPEVVVYSSLEQALLEEKKRAEVFVIGGGEIYTQSMDWVDEIWLTYIDLEVGSEPQDVKFPSIVEGKFNDFRFVLVDELKKEGNPNLNFAKYIKKQ